MAFITDRKRATGLGSAKTGTEHHWAMTKSSVALLILIPLFVFNVGPMLGASHADVVAHFARPYPAIIAGLTIAVSFMHFKDGVQALIEDYTHGMTRKVLIVGMICLCYVAAATGVFAVLRMAL